MLYTCEQCLFLFESEEKPEQCPDCGKFSVREATRAEQEEFLRRAEEKEIWE